MAFQKLVAEARAGKLSPTQVQTKAADLHEGLGRAVGMLITRYPKSAAFVIALYALLKALNLNTGVDVNDLVRQAIEYVESTPLSEDAGDGHMDRASEHKAPKDSKPAQNGPTNKQDRLRHKLPSQTRKRKNAERRAALRKHRREFNPK